MGKYKVITKRAVFHILDKEYTVVENNIVELPEDSITTRALLERNKIVEVTDSTSVTTTQPLKKGKTKTKKT